MIMRAARPESEESKRLHWIAALSFQFRLPPALAVGTQAIAAMSPADWLKHTASLAAHDTCNREARAALKAELEALSTAELEARFRTASADIEAAICQREAIRWEQSQFWNKPEAQADFAYWCAADLWSLDEFAALVLERDPRLVSWETVKGYLNAGSLFPQRYERIRHLVAAAADAGSFGPVSLLAPRVAPRRLVEWALTKGAAVAIPPAMASEVSAFGISVTDYKAALAHQEVVLDAAKKLIAAYDERIAELEATGQPAADNDEPPLHLTEKKALLRVIYTLASRGQSFAADGVPNMATKAKSWADQSGLALDIKSLRKHLLAAVAHAADQRQRSP